VPRLSVQGGLIVGDRHIDLRHASAYHDHNWGRWHWGDDLGWEWGACHARDPAVTLVVSRATNRAHSHATGTMLLVDAAGERRTFSGPGIRIDYHGRLATEMKRVPGALAALHQDRIAAPLPARIMVHADDGVDAITINFQPRAAAQLIAGDPARRGYGFLHEMVGEFEVSGRISGQTVAATGLAVFEHVN
jgi:hypothetical protein